MKITLLSTYPVEPAFHGGQHRLLNMAAMLRGAGHHVQSVGILGSDTYPATRGFLPFPGHGRLNRFIDNSFLMEDWAIGRLAEEDGPTFDALSAQIDPNSDAIFCEHPWLFAFAKKYLSKNRKKNTLLVYESHNVESDLKRQIIEAYFGRSEAIRCQRMILEAESNAMLHADLISAVSQSDADWMRSRTKVPIVVAPNGVTARRASIQDIRAANAIAGHRKFALFVASGHPPNVLGFFDIFGEGVGCFAPADRMIVAGAAGQAIKANPKFQEASGLPQKYIDAGMVSESALRGLLQIAHCVFLPMMSGGGTNLKTAEALWSGRSVVATTHAMRGFEEFADAPGVFVASGKAEFLGAVGRSMRAPKIELDKKERDRRRKLLWENTLRPVIDAIAMRTN